MTSMSLFLILVSMFEGAVMLLLPHYSPRRYFFAITVAPEFHASAEARRSLRRYHLWVVVSILLSVVAARFELPPVLPFVIGFAAFLRERAVIRRHAAALPPQREADLTPDADQLPTWMPVSVLAFAAPLGAAAWLRARWDEIPARFPIHYDAVGQPDRWADKSVQSVYAPLLFAAAVMLVILVLSVAMFYGARRGPQRLAILKLMIAGLYIMALVFSGMALLPIVNVPIFVFFVPIPVFVVVAVVWSYRLVRTQPAEATPDGAWYLGAIYFNPQDAAVFVQKRVGFGYTVNFGNRLAWVVLGSMAAVFGGLTFLLPK